MVSNRWTGEVCRVTYDGPMSVLNTAENVFTLSVLFASQTAVAGWTPLVDAKLHSFVMSLMGAIARSETKRYVSILSSNITGTLSKYIVPQMLAMLRAQETMSVALPHFYLQQIFASRLADQKFPKVRA